MLHRAIGGKALIAADEMVGKLRMMRAVADDAGNPEFVIIARTDGLSAVDAPEPARGVELAIGRALAYLDSGVPDLVWCEFPTADREPLERFTGEVRRRFPDAGFAFNYSSSFKWFNDPAPLTFAELAQMGVRFVFITLGGQHASGLGLSRLLQAMAAPGAGVCRAPARGVDERPRPADPESPFLLRGSVPSSRRGAVRWLTPGRALPRGSPGRQGRVGRVKGGRACSAEGRRR